MKDRYHIKLTIFLGWLFMVSWVTTGQTVKSFDILNDDIQDALPPLAVLLDSAITNDPYVSFRNRQITVNSGKMTTQKKQWFRNFGVQADVRYGTFDNWSTNTAEGQNPSPFATTRSEAHYGVGAYIKFPVFDFVNQKNLVNIARVEIMQAEDMYEMQMAEVRQNVIRQYNDLITRQRVLRIKSKYVETTRMNMLMAEKEFINGVIPISEYSRLAELAQRAEADNEEVKMAFRNSYMILEEIVRFKLNVKFDLP